MSAKTLHVVARVSAKPDAAAQVAAILSKLIEPSRQEAGCVRYELFQNQSNPAELVFVEEWADEAALNTHLASAHLQSALNEAKPFLSKIIDMRKYSVLEGA